MKNDLLIKNNIVISEHELEITASRTGGLVGQHVNKTNTRITMLWDVINTVALNEEQKGRVVVEFAISLDR